MHVCADIRSESFNIRCADTAGKVKLKCSAISVGIISLLFLSNTGISLLLSSANAFHGEPIQLEKIQLKTDVILSPTSVVRAIMDYAEHKKDDLIVIGIRGRSGFNKMFLGSVATGVVTYASCPAMVVK